MCFSIIAELSTSYQYVTTNWSAYIFPFAEIASLSWFVIGVLAGLYPTNDLLSVVNESPSYPSIDMYSFPVTSSVYNDVSVPLIMYLTFTLDTFLNSTVIFLLSCILIK